MRCLLRLAFVLLLSTPGYADSYYNEIFDETGKPRPGYAEILPFYQKLTDAEKRKFEELSVADFQGDNALDPLPRILTESDQRTLRRGVEQRGTALRLFLSDYFAGKTERFAKVIPKPALDKIVKRAGLDGWGGKVHPDSVAFPYGPDIMRDADGAWRVVEDNLGYIGGPGDLVQARETLFNRLPGYAGALAPVNDPARFYRDLAQRYRELAKPKSGQVVMIAVPSDGEDDRLFKIYRDLGIEIVTPHSQKGLVFDARGAWLEEKSSGAPSRKRVGFVIVHGEHQTFARMKSAKGMVAALAEGRVASNYSPGVDFIDDKEFYLYVDDLVRHYLKQEPILRSLPTQRFARIDANGAVSVDRELLEKVFSSREKYVIKAVDGRGGDSVWVGPKISSATFKAVKGKILAEPERFIVQDYNHLSVVDDKIVDLRMISAVDRKGVYVSETPWGRALPIEGDGKVNLSSRGREMTVLIVQDQKRGPGCVDAFRSLSVQ